MRRFALVAIVVGFVSLTSAAQIAPSMSAHFIDVGQAHATLLEFPCGAMLIDAGAQDDTFEDALVNYLERFFAARPHLNRTLKSILITHNHKDHTSGLRRVVETFNVERYIDNGWSTGSGKAGPNWLRAEVAAGRRTTIVRDIQDDVVEKAGTGFTDSDIDPFACAGGDPDIRILQGSFRDENPGWPDGEHENQNNHSLVARVGFGTASFLFLGDLEVAGIELLVDFYDDTPAGRRLLNADVLQVGHHGSHNATTVGLLTAVTPSVAVIPVGKWDFGKQPANRFSTFAYGHPRKYVVDLLGSRITRRRSQPVEPFVGLKAKQFQRVTVSKAIYATGWDGNVRVTARSAQDIRVNVGVN